MTWGSIALDVAKRLLLGSRAGAYVKSADDVLHALVEDLTTSFATSVQEDGELLYLSSDESSPVGRELWRRPRREAVWQAYVRRFLALRVDRVFFGRELQVGAQEFPDLVAVPLGGATSPAEEVLIEVKLTDHDEVLTALKTQLVGRYMNGTSRRHGIYLVIFLAGSTRRGSQALRRAHKSDGVDSYRKQLAADATALDATGRIQAIVIDGRHPKELAPRSKSRRQSFARTSAAHQRVSDGAPKPARRSAATTTTRKGKPSRNAAAPAPATKPAPKKGQKPTQKTSTPKKPVKKLPRSPGPPAVTKPR